MKKEILFFIVCAFINFSLIAQKPLIDLNGQAWDGIGDRLISNNGEYIAYYAPGQNLFIRSTLSAWQITVPRAILVAITQDNRKVIFKRGDSVGIMDLHSPSELQYLVGIEGYRVVKQSRDSDLLIYRSKQRADQVVIREIESGKQESYSGVENYWTSDDGNVVVFKRIREDTSKVKYELNWLDVRKGKLRIIWEGENIGDLKIGNRSSQCIFTTNSGAGSSASSIWFYRNIDDKAVMVLDGESESLKGMIIKGVNSFNDKSGRVFIYLNEHNVSKKLLSTFAPVDIWNYKDAMLQSEQLAILKGDRNSFNYMAVLNLINRQVIRLEYENENVISTLYDDKAIHYVLLLKDGGGSSTEWNWNTKSRKDVYLVNLDNGNRRVIAASLPDAGLYSYVLSYNENYVFYYVPKAKGYYSYKIDDSTRKNMTSGVQGRWEDDYGNDEPTGSYFPYSIAALIRNTDAILVCDQNDVFKLDPTSHILSKNLTKIAGQPHNLVFRIMGGSPFVDSNQRVCLSVFNRSNKDACLTQFSIDQATKLGPLNFEPYRFGWEQLNKARDTSVYIVVKMSAEKSPNLFFTRDFLKYSPITNVYPESGYNWLTTELITWKTFDGGISQGILYKPENFDPHKKYPLLVYYYERLSDNLHKFIYPGGSTGLLNITYYVSHGYLVFEPDIHYRVGWPGRSAYNCVVSGVQYLMKRSYVDGKRMGLQGHSFGGFETNYIITHSHLFTAAMSASGMTDFVSAYGSVIGDGSSRQRQYELYRDRIGATLWERPDLYIENSPVFRANKVTTPLLMMTNYDDEDVPCQQGIEFFTALRRLGKKAWMLQYDREGHNVFRGPAQEDLTIRMAQFFNYYLKGEPPPKWMTSGVPAKLKGTDSGLEVDGSGAKP